MRFLARRLALPFLLFAALAACAGADEGIGSDHGARSGDPERIASTSEAMTVDEIIARAQEYVAANVPYCGGVRGGTDYICGGTCQRPAAAWDDYRSDCSGFVSWCWQIASDPTTSGYMNDKSGSNGWTSIDIDELKAGDAVVCDGHIKLFSKFVGSGQAEIYEEYNCGHTAHKAVQSFTRSGNTIKFSYDSRVYHAIRRNGLTSVELKSYLDTAGSSIDGWAVDMAAQDQALTVDAYVDGDAKTGFHVQGKADLPRPDVAKAIGVDPNHGFSIATPLYFCDGVEHALTVLGKPAGGSSSGVTITGAAKALDCAVPPAIQGVLRHVVDPASLEAWKLDVHKSLRWVTSDDRAAYAVSVDLPAKPEVGRTDDGRAWVVDGEARRLITGKPAAWGFDDAAIGALSAEAAALPEGLPLPVRPVLVQAVGTPAIYVLDVDPAHPHDDPGSDNPVYMSATGKRRWGSDTADSCAIARGPSSPPGASLFALAALAALGVRRRERRHR
jgi:MYXO-CTERM domain-containing protein